MAILPPGIGHNSAAADPPPEPTPFDIALRAVDLVYSETEMWMDGAVVDNQDLADGINGLITELSKARKLADETRKTENKPFDDGKKAVQALYNPLIEKCDLAISACKKALEPWLKKVADEIAEKQRLAREEADRKRREAEAAIRASDATNLVERSRAEALVKEAKVAEKAAVRVEKQTATAGGGYGGRATGLRSVYSAVMTDPVAASRHYWKTRQAEVIATMQLFADEECRLGVRDIPGFAIVESKKAV